jgi:hypothetical protein
LLFVFDRDFLKTHIAFMRVPAATASYEDDPRAALETAPPPELERRQDVHAVGTGVFPSWSLFQGNFSSITYAATAAVATLSYGFL